ncbi:MAG TPA: L,D-transpeptidase [Patescibacteria group bacterium]|nr:L,D-transpeptidase [Patescibacteria group bacterium]
MAKYRKNNFPYLITVLSVVLISLGIFISKRNVSYSKCANTLSCEESLNFSINNDETAVFNGEIIKPPEIDLAQIIDEPKVLGEETAVSDKRIEVDLTTQTLKAYEGEKLYMESKISSGKMFPTPNGEFTIWRKIRATKMSGGTGNGYYYLPNVPYVMFFSGSKLSAGLGFSLHGTYWHDNFGHPMSHGCVNMKTRDAKKLFEWVDPPMTPEQKQSEPGETGTKIIIYGKAP